MSTEPERVLAFEVAGVAFSLPLADVREVADLADLGPLRAVPTLPRGLAGIANHRGDAVPVVEPAALLDVPAASPALRCQILVLGGSGDEPGRMGLPIDRVLGLAPAPRSRRVAEGIVRSRSILDGRMLLALDGAALLARAEEAIGRAQEAQR